MSIHSEPRSTSARLTGRGSVDRARDRCLSLTVGLLLLTIAFVLATTITPAHAIPRLAQCSNNVDDDADGKLDYPADPDCAAPTDAAEAGSTVRACSNGANAGDTADGDTLIDYPADPGCASASDNTEDNPGTLPACGDNQDSDGDGKMDRADPGCVAASDPSEQDTACGNGVDDDGDGKADAADFGCMAPAATANGPDQLDGSEADAPACSDGRDNDNDGTLDTDTNIAGQTRDPGCASPTDNDETNPAPTPPGPQPSPGQPGAPAPLPGTPGTVTIPSPSGPVVVTNPLVEQGHAHNGTGIADVGKLTAGLRNKRGLKRTGRVTPGHMIRLRGRLREPSGVPISGATLQILDGATLYVVHTRKDGRYSKTLRWGPSRQVTVQWWPWGDSLQPIAVRVRLLGAAKVTLHVKARPGSFAFSGSVYGAHKGARVTVQAMQGGRWVLVSNPALDGLGRFHAARKVTVGGQRLCFRSRWLAQPGSAYSAGFSKKVCSRGR